MPTIQHLANMQRRGGASASSSGSRTVLDLDFGSTPRTSGKVSAILEGATVGDTIIAAFSEWVWDANQHTPIILQPGQVLALRAPVAMDAAGTWQFSITADYYEL